MHFNLKKYIVTWPEPHHPNKQQENVQRDPARPQLLSDYMAGVSRRTALFCFHFLMISLHALFGPTDLSQPDLLFHMHSGFVLFYFPLHENPDRLVLKTWTPIIFLPQPPRQLRVEVLTMHIHNAFNSYFSLALLYSLLAILFPSFYLSLKGLLPYLNVARNVVSLWNPSRLLLLQLWVLQPYDTMYFSISISLGINTITV